MAEEVKGELHRWEKVDAQRFRHIDRMRVPGGWLYCVKWIDAGGAVATEHVVFVPKPPMELR